VHIVIAEDDALVRAGLAALLRGEGFEVTAVPDGERARELVETGPSDVAILDVRMPPTHTDEGIRTAVAIRESRPRFPVLVLSAWVERTFATELMGRDASGVGYLLKDQVGHVEEFLDALDRVARGETAVDADVVAQLFARDRAARALDVITEREREVLSLMAQGLGNHMIATRLFVTEGAVHKHIRNVFGKLDLAPGDGSDRRVAAVLRYLESDGR